MLFTKFCLVRREELPELEGVTEGEAEEAEAIFPRQQPQSFVIDPLGPQLGLESPQPALPVVKPPAVRCGLAVPNWSFQNWSFKIGGAALPQQPGQLI